jgi:hypothetical protein
MFLCVAEVLGAVPGCLGFANINGVWQCCSALLKYVCFMMISRIWQPGNGVTAQPM